MLTPLTNNSKPIDLFMVQPGSAFGMSRRVTTLERRDDKALIESALDNTEKIVANLLATKQKQVVLKERTPCYVVL